MNVQPVITSQHNASFKDSVRLHEASERRDRHLFIIEGTHLVEEAIATEWPLKALWYEESWADEHASLFERIRSDKNRAGMLLQPTTCDLMRRLSTTSSRTPVIGIANHPKKSLVPTHPISLGLVVESLQDPGNLGSMIRIAAAVGIGQVILSQDSVSPTNPKVLRATAGQWFRSPPLVADLPTFLTQQAAASVQILAAAADGVSFWEHDLKVPTLFLLGNEGSGLSMELREIATATVSVPMANGVESLNVSIAAALLLYEAQRQRR